MQPQWQQQWKQQEQQEEERLSQLHTAVILASQLEEPGTIRLWGRNSRLFADVKAVQRENRVVEAVDLHRSWPSRLISGPDVRVRIDK